MEWHKKGRGLWIQVENLFSLKILPCEAVTVYLSCFFLRNIMWVLKGTDKILQKQTWLAFQSGWAVAIFVNRENWKKNNTLPIVYLFFETNQYFFDGCLYFSRKATCWYNQHLLFLFVDLSCQQLYHASVAWYLWLCFIYVLQKISKDRHADRFCFFLALCHGKEFSLANGNILSIFFFFFFLVVI